MFSSTDSKQKFEPVFSTVIMAVCSLFNRMLLLTDLIPVHLLHCGRTMVIGCSRISFEWIRALRHIYGLIRHMRGLYISSRVHIRSMTKYNQHELHLPYTKSGVSLYLGQVWIAATLRWGKFVYLRQVCKCGESSVLLWTNYDDRL